MCTELEKSGKPGHVVVHKYFTVFYILSVGEDKCKNLIK